MSLISNNLIVFTSLFNISSEKSNNRYVKTLLKALFSVFDKYSGVAFGASATAGSVLPSSVIPGGKGAGSAPFCFSNTNYNITYNFPPLQQPESGAPEELGKIFIFW